MGVVTFNGISSDSLSYPLVIEVPPDYEVAERDYDITHVPGRNGDFIIDNGSFKNVKGTFYIATGTFDGEDVFTELGKEIAEWLHSCSGYARLEDSYNPDWYRLACYHDEMTITNIYNQGARVTVEFDCKPQKFLLDGEEATTFTASGTLTNPTNFNSLPEIIVYMDSSSSGVLTIGDYSLTIASGLAKIVIDSELQDAYLGTVNRNSYVTLDDDMFPVLEPGDNAISFSGGITSVVITPRWWTI